MRNAHRASSPSPIHPAVATTPTPLSSWLLHALVPLLAIAILFIFATSPFSSSICHHCLLHSPLPSLTAPLLYSFVIIPSLFTFVFTVATTPTVATSPMSAPLLANPFHYTFSFINRLSPPYPTPLARSVPLLSHSLIISTHSYSTS